MRACFCLGSGPSLNQADVDAVLAARIYTIACNLSYRLALTANILYAMDSAFWRNYHAEIVASGFSGRMICPVIARKPGVELKRFQHGRHSGYGAIMLARLMGFNRVYLLGYDCQYSNAKKHFHGSHKKGMGNAERVSQWVKEYERIPQNDGFKIINCTRQTAITSLTKQDLESALCELQSLPVAPVLKNSGTGLA